MLNSSFSKCYGFLIKNTKSSTIIDGVLAIKYSSVLRKFITNLGFLRFFFMRDFVNIIFLINVKEILVKDIETTR